MRPHRTARGRQSHAQSAGLWEGRAVVEGNSAVSIFILGEVIIFNRLLLPFLKEFILQVLCL